MAVKDFTTIDSTLDVTTTRTLLHEAIPLTGTIVSGTYGTFRSDNNVKNYSHGMFQSVYDYPYLSSSANHIFDIVACFAASSSLSASTTTARAQRGKKINLYTQYAQTLLGYTGSLSDPSREIRHFENDLTLDNSNGGTNQMKEVYILNFSRLLTKDQIKKGTFSMTIGTGSYGSANGPLHTFTLSDASASADGTGCTSTQGGDMGLLYSDVTNKVSGAIFYQAGIVVLSGSIAMNHGGKTGKAAASKDDLVQLTTWGKTLPDGVVPTAGATFQQLLTGSSISSSCDILRHRIKNVSFNNTTEINSKIYFCRVPHNKYNYSSNPTYLSASQIRVKTVETDTPVAYITTVGLYNDRRELLAVAKLSEPIRKDPTNDLTIRVRLDY